MAITKFGVLKKRLWDGEGQSYVLLFLSENQVDLDRTLYIR